VILISRNDLNIVSCMLPQYIAKGCSFPLIASVLQGIQEGEIFSDDHLVNFVIVHKFGFADILEIEPIDSFDNSLERFLFDRLFSQEKLRLYNVPKKLINKIHAMNDSKIAVVDRSQYVFSGNIHVDNKLNLDEFTFDIISNQNYDIIEAKLALSLGERFWSSKEQFLNFSFGVVAYHYLEPVAVCYACSIADGRAEVDIFTHPAFRKKGLGKLLVGEFINICIDRGLKANWDCYLNNTASVSLAESFNFKQVAVYSHAIIAK